MKTCHKYSTRHLYLILHNTSSHHSLSNTKDYLVAKLMKYKFTEIMYHGRSCLPADGQQAASQTLLSIAMRPMTYIFIYYMCNSIPGRSHTVFDVGNLQKNLPCICNSLCKALGLNYVCKLHKQITAQKHEPLNM